MTTKYTTYVIDSEHYIPYDKHKELVKGYEDAIKKLKEDKDFWYNAYHTLNKKYDEIAKEHSDMQVEYICQKEKYELRDDTNMYMSNYILGDIDIMDNTTPEVKIKKKKQLKKSGKKLP
jgi:hypothetical protein